MATGFPTFNPTPPAQPLPSSGPQQPPQAPQQGQGMEAAASPVMQLLSNWHRVSGEIAQHFPMIASMMQKVASETQQALLILAREASQDQQGQGSQPSATPQTAQPQGYQPSGF